jgi:DNA-directed RNA polymerase subunit beta'
MAVHVPLSLEAQLEARVLMMSTNNVLSPANGKPIIVPSQDMVLGLYYVSLEKEGEPNEGMMLADMAEIEHAMQAGLVNLHTKIVSRFDTVDDMGNPVRHRVETTPGRMKLASLLPKNHMVPFDLVNKVLRKGEVGELIDTVYRHCGQKESVIFCDQIMTLGFQEAFKAGISFGKDDMVIPEAKWSIVNETRDQVAEFEQQYQDGLITHGEKYNKVVDTWAKCTDRVADEMMKEIQAVQIDEETGREKEPNSIWMMSASRARGSPAQMRQLAAMRGLMAKPSGEIIETPIPANFGVGLNVVK